MIGVFALLRMHFKSGSQSLLHSQLMQPPQWFARNFDNRAADADEKVKNSWSARGVEDRAPDADEVVKNSWSA